MLHCADWEQLYYDGKWLGTGFLQESQKITNATCLSFQGYALFHEWTPLRSKNAAAPWGKPGEETVSNALEKIQVLNLWYYNTVFQLRGKVLAGRLINRV